MTQDTESTGEKSWDEIFRRSLKTVSVEQIETAFAKALHELTGQEFEVDLRRLDLNPDANAWVTDTALIDLKVSKQVSKRSDGEGKGRFRLETKENL